MENDKVTELKGENFALIGKELSLFEPVRVSMEKETPPASFVSCYRVSDPGVHVRQSFGVRFNLPPQAETPQKWGVYLLNGGDPQFIGNKSGDVEKSIQGETRRFGQYCLGKDMGTKLNKCSEFKVN